jgi:hypothetical protein
LILHKFFSATATQATHLNTMVIGLLANGLRYPRVGGTRQRHFAGTHLKPHKLPKNAQTPTRRVHALLGGFFECKTPLPG